MTVETHEDAQFPNGKLACSIKKFADLTDFGRTTIYEAIRDGSLVARKNGKRTVITAHDGMRWLKSLPPANSAAAA
ncbi:MAG: helix-turn-helix domain-containing protein [Pseudolabrys sp.]|nr:helix-turn-helix domain-containing protein [Pseudolabrys sp.]MDP2296704.1 helix-turn-helix domain-containing protein [Pseudolabrys sp.]